MSYYLGIPLLFFLALTEAAVLPLFRIGGLQPNLVLVMLIVWLMVRGANEAFVLIPIGGLFLGLVDGAPLGTALLAMSPLAFLQEARGARLSERGLLLTILFSVVMTLSFHLVYLALYTVQGQAGSWPAAMLRVIIPTAFLNVMVLLPFYWVVSLFSQELRRATYA